MVGHPLNPGVEMVKQVDHLPGERVAGVVLGDSEYWLVGSNPEASTDSRSLGPFGAREIRAIVLFRYFPMRRARAFR